MSNEIKINDDSIVIKRRKPGVEGNGPGAAFPIDINGDGNSLGLDAFGEVAGTNVLAFAIYGCLLHFLELEPLVRSGDMTRAQQMKLSGVAAWNSTKNNAVSILGIAVVIGVCPWATPFFGLLGLLGMGVMSVRVVRAFYDALSDEQRDNLKQAADNAGVKLRGLTDKKATATGGAA